MPISAAAARREWRSRTSDSSAAIPGPKHLPAVNSLTDML